MIPFYPDPTPTTLEHENYTIAPAATFTALALLYGIIGVLHAALAKLAPRFPRRAAHLQFWIFQSGIVIAQSPNLAWLSARDLDRRDCNAFMQFWYDLSNALLILPLLALALMLILLIWALFTRLRRPPNQTDNSAL